KYGGIAMYISGDLGAVEIIGDTNNKRGDRIKFDGKEFPLNANGNRPAYTFERTEAIGRDIAKAAFEALERGEWNSLRSFYVNKAAVRAPMDNQAYILLSAKGVLDTMPPPKQGVPIEIETQVYAITIGNAQIITTPGELFPEVFYGVDANRRRDCLAADTGLAAEPAIRERMPAKYVFVLGLCPDEFGYIVPAYDFRAPSPDSKRGLIETRDACKQAGVPDHYHETNSASSQLAARW